MTPFVRVAAEVQEAVTAGSPVVALESTIFTHGLPRPRNVEVAEEAEQIVRDAGAVPATIGVVHGEPVVGLTRDEIVELSQDDDVLKSGIRELPIGAVNRKNAGTTIAATSLLAHRAGVKVFATGGLGGVHHGASTNFDESADLLALALNPIVLVSSGAKAVLDVHATLERFESLSVPIVGYRTHAYPGFYSTESGFAVPHRIETPQDAATIYATQRALDLTTALLVANPSRPTSSSTRRCSTGSSRRPGPRSSSRASPGRRSPPSSSTSSAARRATPASTPTSRSTATTCGWRRRSPSP